MPFKSGKRPSDVSRRIQQILTTELDKDIESGLFSMYTVLSGTSDYYVPVDTSKLVQERTYRIRKKSDGWVMTYGYYTEYAQYLHDSTDWQPRPPNSPGKKGGGYNPNAQPNWLNIAWNESGQEALSAFAKVAGK